MIFAHEVERCVKGLATPSQQLEAIEHYTELGGFHTNVLDSEQKAFKTWLASSKPLPDQNAQPVEQLDLLGVMT